ncbi:MAG: TIGR02147 family protein [Bdellovibrio sp.]|nr:TIGR02147 family protein [Bdellovibrio sp.]
MKVISIYEYTDYKKFVLDWLKSQPQGGRGFYTAVAERLGTSNAAVSQIFRDDRHLNLEHATELTEMLHLTESESFYFLLLVNYGRAGSVKLQKKLIAKIKLEQSEQQKLVNRVAKDTYLSDEVKSIYYSSWIYTGLRNLIAVEEIQSLEELANRLKVNRTQLQKIVQFLIDHNLLLMKNNRLEIGPQKTHLESTSPWIQKHHHNWRIKGMESMQNFDEKNLFYSAPMSLSVAVAEKIRQQLPEFIKQIVEQVGPSKSETVRCLNIDWFEY